MKRALYIGGFIMPDGNAAAQRVLGIAKVLRCLDYEVRFAGLQHHSRQPESGTVDGFDYIGYPYPQSPMDWFRYLTGRDYSIGEIKTFKPGIVILYNHPAFAIERIAKFCHKHGVKVIADVTEWYEASGNPVFKAVKGYDIKRRMKKSHLKLDGLICISRYLTDYYAAKKIPVVNIPPLIDRKQSKWHQETDDNSKTIKIVYAGSPGASKDRLDLILAGLDNQKDDFTFTVIGITHEQYINTWHDTTIHPYARFLGRIPHEEVIRYLLDADYQIFLRPDTLANQAGFPTKFVETITSGTLPITNLSSNLEDFIGGNTKSGAIVIKSLSSKDITTAIQGALIRSRNELDAMKSNLDSETFDFNRYVTPVQQFLMEL